MRRLLAVFLLGLFSSVHATFCVPEPGDSDELLRNLKGNPVTLTQTVRVPGNSKGPSMWATFNKGQLREWVWLGSGVTGKQPVIGVVAYDQKSPGIWLGKLGLPMGGNGVAEKIAVARQNIAAGQYRELSHLGVDGSGRLTGFQGFSPRVFMTDVTPMTVLCRYSWPTARQVTEIVDMEGRSLVTYTILLDGSGRIQSIRNERQLYDSPPDMITFNNTLGATVYTTQQTYVYGTGNRLMRVDTADIQPGTTASRPSGRATYHYDDRGSLIHIDTTLNGRSSSRTFKYDKWGNWVEQTEHTAEGDTLITTRAITY